MNLDGDLIIHAGMTRTFKTLRARAETAGASRLIVWDPKGRWAELDRCAAVFTRRQLLDLVNATGTGPARIAFVSHDRQDFPYWCSVAFWWGRWAAEYGIRTVAVAEDTATYTGSQKAPEGVHELLSMGLEFGLSVYMLTTALAESEKTSIRNRTLLRVGQCDRDPDADLACKELKIPRAEIDLLKPLEFIERDRRAGTLKKFVPAWRGANPPRNPRWREVPLAWVAEKPPTPPAK